jgi:DNA-binding winged helix-turn-helix (wHTH) protein
MNTRDGYKFEDAISFGPFMLYPAKRLLEREGVPVVIGARALDVLIVLVEHAGQLVTKKLLINRVWSGLTVGEGSLRFQLVALRKALGEGRSGARYVSTLPGRGYSFVAPTQHSLGSDQTPVSLAMWGPADSGSSQFTRIAGCSDATQVASTHSQGNRFVTFVGPGGTPWQTVALPDSHVLLAEFEGGVRLSIAPIDHQAPGELCRQCAQPSSMRFVSRAAASQRR